MDTLTLMTSNKMKIDLIKIKVTYLGTLESISWYSPTGLVESRRGQTKE